MEVLANLYLLLSQIFIIYFHSMASILQLQRAVYYIGHLHSNSKLFISFLSFLTSRLNSYAKVAIYSPIVHLQM